LTKKLNQHVMKSSFRIGLTEVYRNALKGVGVNPSEIKPHMDSSATVTVTDAQLATMRAKLAGMTELSGHSNAGRVTIHIPAAEQYLANNRPTLTDEERAAKGRKGTGTGVDKAEAERRRAAREALKAKLATLHGIDLDGGDDDADEDEEEGDDE
jgi:hypothetical protein